MFEAPDSCLQQPFSQGEWLVPLVASALALRLMQREPREQSEAATGNQLVACNRLDAATSGLTVLARTKAAAERFRNWLEEGAVKKRYRAFVSGREVQANTSLEHWISDSVFGKPAPRLVAPMDAPIDDGEHQWKAARMTVLSTDSLEGGQEALLDLHTGRTHQIRAQLAAVGSPIVNDSLYRNMASFLWRSTCDDKIAADLVQGANSGEELPIGLQCAELSFGGVAVRAPAPWWQKCLRCICSVSASGKNDRCGRCMQEAPALGYLDDELDQGRGNHAQRVESGKLWQAPLHAGDSVCGSRALLSKRWVATARHAVFNPTSPNALLLHSLLTGHGAERLGEVLLGSWLPRR